jgi:hypothetical protein
MAQLPSQDCHAESGGGVIAERRLVVWSTTTNPHGTGSWAVIDGLLHVRCSNGTKIADLGAHPPECLASILMMELAMERAADA